MDIKKNKRMVLVVDDVEANRFMLKNIIQSMGYMPVLVENGEQALTALKKFEISLVIMDIAMPVMDGYECCKHMKDDVTLRDIPIIFISAFDEAQDIVRGFDMGGNDYITKPFIPEVVKARVDMHLRLHDSAEEMTEMNKKLQMSINSQLEQMENEKKNVLYVLGRIARENARYDENNMNRLGKNCRILSEAMQLSVRYDNIITDEFIDTIEISAPLCDIGNLSIPSDILGQETLLNDEDKELMKTHTSMGYRIVKDIYELGGKNDFLLMAVDIVHYHHENWDGSGYPSGIKGEEIPLAAQIVAIVSAFCAMTEDRTYRQLYSREEAISIMESEAGVKFNPDIFSILKKIYKQFV